MNVELYESIVKKYTPYLYKYCSHRLEYDRQLTEEAVNDTMRILFVKWDTLDIGEHILKYLCRVADNCIMQVRERENRYYSRHISPEKIIKRGMPGKLSYFDDYFHDPETEEAFIKDTVEELPEEYKTIFTYRYVDRKTIMEVAELTGMPYSTLRFHLAKIEEYIEQKVKKYY